MKEPIKVKGNIYSYTKRGREHTKTMSTLKITIGVLIVIILLILSSCSSETEQRVSKLEKRVDSIEHPKAPKNKFDAHIDSLTEDYKEKLRNSKGLLDF